MGERTPPKPICLGLQGGGAHGAFTWGVMDALAEDGRLSVAAISATSAGAVNGAAWAHGFHEAGSDGARARLRSVWEAIAATPNAFHPGALGASGFPTPFHQWMFGWLDAVSRLTSPYDLNPLGDNPLRRTLEGALDIGLANACPDLKLFIAATNVRTGKARIYRKEAVTLDAVLASACLPFLFQAIEIDGEPYWDGGFTANPALWPFFYEDTPDDIVIVHVNPMRREGPPPKSALDIVNRVNEVTFNASLLAELRAIAFVKKLKARNWLADDAEQRYRDARIHSIFADEALADLGADTKYRTDRGFIDDLFNRGRETAFAWLNAHGEAVGVRSSVDLQADFLDAPGG